jgi:hypothetical protein
MHETRTCMKRSKMNSSITFYQHSDSLLTHHFVTFLSFFLIFARADSGRRRSPARSERAHWHDLHSPPPSLRCTVLYCKLNRSSRAPQITTSLFVVDRFRVDPFLYVPAYMCMLHVACAYIHVSFILRKLKTCFYHQVTVTTFHPKQIS